MNFFIVFLQKTRRALVVFVRWAFSDALEGKMKLFVEALEKNLTAQDIDTHLEGCIGCGCCGQHCAWYIVDQKAENHPKMKADALRAVYKRFCTASGIVLGNLGLIKTTTEEDLARVSELFFSRCTMCGRCSTACPQGVSNRRLVYLMRLCLTAAGFAPQLIYRVQADARDKRHSFGLTYEGSVGKIIAAAEARGINIPVDRHGAKWLAACSAIINTKMPEVAAEVFRLLDLGVHYTMSSRIQDTGTESMVMVCDRELGRRFVRELAEEAKRLGCEGVIIGECGCDMRSYNVDEADILREYGLKVAYIDGLILDLIDQGRIPISKLDLVVAYHDPCWSARLTGYMELSRRLVKRCVREFVEMTPNRRQNYCCNGGAGSMRFHPATGSDANLRRQVSVLKARQIEQTHADMVVTPCATCFMSLKDTASFYGLATQVSMVADIVLMAMDKAIREREQR